MDAMEQCRVLTKQMEDRIREVMYDTGKMDHLKTVDPQAIDKVWRLLRRLDEAMHGFIDGAIPWDRDVLDKEASVMGAARELYVYIALL